MISIIASSASGLSPLTRGTRFSPRVQIFDWRFIPAGAGNTRFVKVNTARRPVYPRWRGEHIAAAVGVEPWTGLSPLARGTRVAILLAFPHHRFIPAGAGNTGDPQSIQAAAAVYPRWRGEHPFSAGENVEIAGLSPLARGTLLARTVRWCQHRFIPAGAGNTWQPAPQRRADAVYPRWRGEHNCRPFVLSISNGLSPLARGTLPRLFCIKWIKRFIPAGAGNTLSIHNCF